MKQTIEYYYSLKIDEVFLEGDAYHFVYETNNYYFVFFNRTAKDLRDLIEVSRELKNKNIPCHDIILNNQKEVLTKVDDSMYVLLRVHSKNEEYSISEIIELNKKTKLASLKSDLYRNDWANLWSKKIDYIENQMNEVVCDKVIRKSIDYYIGLAENAIYYVNSINELYSISLKDNVVLSRKRIYYPNLGINYLNPLSFIFDLEVRDVAEYIKSAFWQKEDAFLELQTYLKSVPLTPYSYNMLFARLLYPSYYFDRYEKVVNNHADIQMIVDIITRVDAYEAFLKKAYKEISLYAHLQEIAWLIY